MWALGDSQVGRKFKYQIIQASKSPTCKATKSQQNKPDDIGVNYAYSNMPAYFWSSINRTADNRGSEVLINVINDEFIMSGNGCFEDKFSLQIKDSS